MREPSLGCGTLLESLEEFGVGVRCERGRLKALTTWCVRRSRGTQPKPVAAWISHNPLILGSQMGYPGMLTGSLFRVFDTVSEPIGMACSST